MGHWASSPLTLMMPLIALIRLREAVWRRSKPSPLEVSLEGFGTICVKTRHISSGYPQVHNFPDVTNIKFDGCISNITINREPVDLRNTIKSYDVIPGCPAKVITTNQY